MATFEDFQKIDVRVGRIVSAEDIPNARHSTHRLTIDMGPEIGTKTSCARTIRYSKNELAGRLTLCIVNFPPKQVGKIKSKLLDVACNVFVFC